MFQGLETNSKPSSRVLRPPGGGSSNIFGGIEDDAAAQRRPNKMASTVFAPAEETQSAPRRSNPPGGRTSDIFGQPEPPAQPQKPIPPGGPTNVNIFASADSTPGQSSSRAHPNKPKDNLMVGPESPAPEPKVSTPEVKAPPATPEPAKEVPSPAPSTPVTSTDEAALKNHEPHLGPVPRAHNRVLNPPGGKSSVVFY